MPWRGAASRTPTSARWKRASAKITTKNGKAGHVSSSESQGIGIRVLAHRLLGIRGYRRPDGERHRSGGGAGARDRAGGHGGAEARSGAGAGREVRGDVGLAHAHRPVLHAGGSATWRCCWRWTQELRRNPGSQPGRSVDAFRAAAAGVRFHAGQPDRPDARACGRGIFGAVLQGRRDPEALVSRIPSAGSIS